jgi:hypothetical protein
MLANRCVDHTVFVSSWLKALFFQYPPPCASASVIRNGSERTIFHSRGYRPWAGQGPLKIVTHHWGANWLKGFDIYSQLDQLLADKRYRGQITFTYIGNLPQDFRFKHARHIEPQHGKTLAATIRRHHVYLTASQNEPGGNHQNEGANCGLPLLYRKSGCLPEYCHGFGLAFTPKDFEAKLQEMIQTYGRWVSKMADFPLSAQAMCAQYADLFQNILSCREEILRKRARWRQFSWRLHRLLFVAAL